MEAEVKDAETSDNDALLALKMKPETKAGCLRNLENTRKQIPL